MTYIRIRLIASVALAASAFHLHAQTYGKNLVVNGDAESGPASSIPGWSVTGSPAAVLYSADTHLNLKSFGPAVRGNYYFTGTNTAKGVLSQKIDVSASSTAIDAGSISYDASGYLGGANGDNSSLTISFLGTTGNTISSFTLGPLTDADRTDDTGIYFQRRIGLVPASTRNINVEVDLLRTSGSANYGCADNISLILNNDAVLPTGFFGSNLIVNGNAEAPNGTQLPFPLTSILDTGIIDLPGWVRSGDFTLDLYSPDSDLDVDSPGPPDRGSWFFYGGPSSASGNAMQDIDVAGAASQIDSGKVTFNLSGWIGGYYSQDDNLTLTAKFMNWQGTVLGSSALGPVLAAERNDVSSLLKKSQTGSIPVGTRMIRITMDSIRKAGADDDGLADSLSLVLTAPGAGGSTPVIQSGGVMTASAFGGFNTIAPGTWVEIYGSSLAGSSREWAGADFSGNTAPTSLDGTTVSIAGQKAFIRYISPGQVNAQVPSNISPGPQQLTVTANNLTSAAYPITVNSAQPGLLAPNSFLIGGKQYVTAMHADGTFVLPPNAINGVSTRQAQPGETILLYGVGFGSVTPSINAGQIVGVANQLSLPLQIQFAQSPAAISYAGLSPNFVGLYQFNVTVPNISDSDLVPLTFNLGGTAGSQTVYIAIKR